jgi:protein ImuB
MKRVASLCLPQLPIERLRRQTRPSAPPERALTRPEPPPEFLDDDDPGRCSVPRGGGWRPGAKWAQPRHPRAGEDPVASGAASEDWIPAFAGITKVIADCLPIVLVTRTGQRETIAAACPAALSLGLVPGMAAAQARALVPALSVQEADPQADRVWLDRLALHAACHWTPNACVSGPDGLWLDLTGTTHLFGGEERFCRRLLRFLARLGFSATVAIAGTPGAAHGLARYSGRSITVLPPGAETEALAQLPVAALRLSSEALSAAARFGFERVGDLYPVPRGPLARRLGLATVERLDQARGLAPEPIEPVVPFEIPLAERRLLEPIVTAEAIEQVIGDLARDLATVLQARALGLRSAVLTCLRVDGEEQRIGFGTSAATRDPAHLARMLGLRVERVDPGLGIERMTLAAPHVEPLAPQTLAPKLGNEAPIPELAPLADQLAARAGSGALFRMSAVESDVPERAVKRAGPLDRPSGWPTWPRPARLLARPEPLSGVVALLPDHPPRRFTWRGKTYRVTRGDGPERIHGEWWRSSREMWAVRDYFRVEAEEGERFWLFRRGDGIEGVTGDLTWYLHGAFG